MKVTETGKRIEIKNGRLTISFNLSAEPGPLVPQGHKRWYAGAATSVRYTNGSDTDIEMLDFYKHYLSLFNWIGHDPEKRCFQIDKLTIFDSKCANGIPAEVVVFDRDYGSIEIGCNEAECWILVQCPIVCQTGNSRANDQSKPTHYLQRKLSLKKDTNYVIDEVSVCRANMEGNLVDTDDKVEFTANYFMFMDCGLSFVFAKELSEGRFMITSADWYDFIPSFLPQMPRFSYGYVCGSDITITKFQTPVYSFPDPAKYHKTFSWQTSRSRNLKSFHLFTFGKDTASDYGLLQKLQSSEIF